MKIFGSNLARTATYHLASLTIAAGTAWYLVRSQIPGSQSEPFQQEGHLFLIVFMVGALALGIGGSIRSALLLTARILRKGFPADSWFRQEFGILMLHVMEINVSILVLAFGGFISLDGVSLRL